MRPTLKKKTVFGLYPGGGFPGEAHHLTELRHAEGTAHFTELHCSNSQGRQTGSKK